MHQKGKLSPSLLHTFLIVACLFVIICKKVTYIYISVNLALPVAVCERVETLGRTFSKLSKKP